MGFIVLGNDSEAETLINIKQIVKVCQLDDDDAMIYFSDGTCQRAKGYSIIRSKIGVMKSTITSPDANRRGD